MTNTDLAIQSPNKPPRLEIRRKLQAALDAMIWDGLEWDDAARHVNLTVAAMRKALSKPHVIAYLRSEREVFRASIAPRNVHRLKEIRDAADNMPAVNAIKVLEQLNDVDQVAAGASHSPHLTIRIVNQISAPDVLNQKDTPTIDHAATIPNSPENDAGGQN